MEALVELEKILPLEEVIKVTILWQTLNSLTPTLDEMKTKGSFLKRCLDQTQHHGVKEVHWNFIESCQEWETRKSLDGLGGCVKKDLVDLI